MDGELAAGNTVEEVVEAGQSVSNEVEKSIEQSTEHEILLDMVVEEVGDELVAVNTVEEVVEAGLSSSNEDDNEPVENNPVNTKDQWAHDMQNSEAIKESCKLEKERA